MKPKPKSRWVPISRAPKSLKDISKNPFVVVRLITTDRRDVFRKPFRSIVYWDKRINGGCWSFGAKGTSWPQPIANHSFRVTHYYRVEPLPVHLR